MPAKPNPYIGNRAQLTKIEEHDHTKEAKRVTILDSSGNAVEYVATDAEGGGKVAVGTSAVEVTFSGTTKSMIISADPNNTGTLYVGKSNVASDGSNAITFLLAGENIEMDYEDSSNALYVVASIASQNFYKGALL